MAWSVPRGGTRRYLTAKGNRINSLSVPLGGPPHTRPLEGATPTLSISANPGLRLALEHPTTKPRIKQIPTRQRLMVVATHGMVGFRKGD